MYIGDRNSMDCLLCILLDKNVLQVLCGTPYTFLHFTCLICVQYLGLKRLLNIVKASYPPDLKCLF